MSAWITDRLPTKSDADCVDEVTVTISGKVRTMNIRNVTEGLPWMRTPHPEPYVKPKVWSWGYTGNEYAIKKNGKSIWVYYETHHLRPRHFDAMTDALNRLEDSHD